MTDYEEISSKVEVVKVGLRHTKDGFLATFAINPTDAPEDFIRDPVGQRYLAVFVRLNDQDEPVASKDHEDGKHAIKLAGALCSDENFQSFLSVNGETDEMSEMAATVWLRSYLKVKSRKELMHDREARKRLLDIRSEYVEYRRHNP